MEKNKISVTSLVGEVRADGLQQVIIDNETFGLLVKVDGKPAILAPVLEERAAGTTVRTYKYDGITFYSVYNFKNKNKFLMKAEDAQARYVDVAKNGFSIDVSDFVTA